MMEPHKRAEVTEDVLTRAIGRLKEGAHVKPVAEEIGVPYHTLRRALLLRLGMGIPQWKAEQRAKGVVRTARGRRGIQPLEMSVLAFLDERRPDFVVSMEIPDATPARLTQLVEAGFLEFGCSDKSDLCGYRITKLGQEAVRVSGSRIRQRIPATLVEEAMEWLKVGASLNEVAVALGRSRHELQQAVIRRLDHSMTIPEWVTRNRIRDGRPPRGCSFADMRRERKERGNPH
jgi:hypothetical protein